MIYVPPSSALGTMGDITMLNVTVNTDVDGYPCSATVESGGDVITYVVSRVESDHGTMWNTGVETDNASVLAAVANAVANALDRRAELGA